MLLKEDLERLAPRPSNKTKAAIWDGYIDALLSEEGQEAMAQAGIVAPPPHEPLSLGSQRFWHFIATCAAETGGFTLLWENMNYRAERIVQVFGARHSARVTAAEARRLAGNAYALAERVYGLGNPTMARRLGNVEPGDGYRFRGLGIGQITGRWNHEECAGAIGCKVEDLELPINALRATCVHWGNGRANEMADQDDVAGVRKIWNGGHNGIELVRAYLARAKRIWPPAGASKVKAIMEMGDRGEHIKRLQAALKERGFSPGAIDGIFGPLTERQVAAFQVAHALIGTGKVDKRTWEILSEPAPPAAAVPGREDIDAKQLTARGSKTVKAGMSINLVGRTLALLGLTGTADALTGLGIVNFLLSNAEQAVALATRANALLGSIVNARTLITTICVIGGGLLMKVGASIVTARVSEAQQGNTTR